MEVSKNKITPLAGIIVFVITIVMLIFIATPIQYKFGIYGVLITELIILLIGLIPAFILKIKLKDMIAIRRPRISEIFGTLLMWMGIYLIVILSTMLIMYFFPQGLEVSKEMNKFIGKSPFILSLLVIAIMPAICEEILHRGFILYTFKNINSKWLTIVIMAMIFGIFHLDPYRFLATAILGGVLAYIMIVTRNIFLPMLLHFINNFISVAASSLTSSLSNIDNMDIEINLVILASYFIIASISPVLLLGGSLLLKGKDKVLENKNTLIISIIVAIVLGVILFATGVIMIILSGADLGTIQNSNL